MALPGELERADAFVQMGDLKVRQEHACHVVMSSQPLPFRLALVWFRLENWL